MFLKKRTTQPTSPYRRNVLQTLAGGSIGALAATVMVPGVPQASAASNGTFTNGFGAWAIKGIFLTRTGPGGINIPHDLGLVTFSLDGNANVAGSYVTAGVGRWAPTSSNTFTFSLVQQIYKGPNQTAVGWDGNVNIYVATATVSSDGQSWSANAVAQEIDTTGAVVCNDTLSLTAVRINLGPLAQLPIQTLS